MDKPQNMHSFLQHIPKQKLKRYFRKKTVFYQLLQHAAVHPSLCSLSWAVGRDRGGLAISLLLLWWEKQWQKENVHLPSPASCRLGAELLIQQIASSAHGLLTREVYLKTHTNCPLHFCGQEDCPDTQIISAAVVHQQYGRSRSFEARCEGSCTCSSLGMCLESGSCLGSYAMWSW